MPFTAHLEDLRSCLIKSLAAVAAGFLVSFAFAENIFSFLTEPLLQIQSPGLTLIGTGVAEAFFTKLKVALIASLFAAFPVILWQLWEFIAPGLYEHEIRYARGFVFFGTLFFLLGAGFCYSVVFDVGYRFFLEQFEDLNIRPAIRISEYLSFASKLMLAFGIVFELPVVSFFFARVGLIDHEFLIRHFRYAVLIIFILAAVLSPPDVISQILLALPLIILYGVSIGVAYLFGSKRRQ